ncbi:carboxymuconolactone decarboxylase family protein [Vibrio rhizosphaerae]|uniref:Carboxymuconolactone decarboxylase family protein n=1 Tax=Vibrio rhizosphaerae TaxID=398736 RepID=A0ABU4IWL3_9VIBR|nr:carboxymuconolactone decarboxylase family protein [Vibrio rhizosphaerae]MDW6093755.1 carboxymuconolactone decarboxylase family protein [Vibrio rhizosphaerae]
MPEKNIAAETLNTRTVTEESIAKILMRARHECTAIPLIDVLSEQDIAFGYQVQKAVIELNQQAGNALIGWKVALSSQPALDRFALQAPIYAPLFAANRLSGPLTQDQVIAPKIESEILFVLGKDLSGKDVSDDEILAAIAWMAPAIEVADCRLQGWKFDIPHFVSDNAAAGFYQVGTMMPFDAQVLEQSGCPCLLETDRTSEVGAAVNVLGGPLGSVVCMIKGILTLFGEVKAGQHFLSGSLTKPVDMVSGHTYLLHLLDQTVVLQYQSVIGNVMTDKFDKGLATRKAVLGAEYVDNSINQATHFTRPLQQLVTEYCWGDIWQRTGLEQRERSLINLAMISALNRPHELALHVRGAVNNGVTVAEIREVLLQVAIYCGVPASIDAFRTAGSVLKEMGLDLDAPDLA